MEQNRRRSIRFPVRLMALVKNAKTGKTQRWLTRNISADGLCLVTDESVERGTQLEIELKLHDFPTPLVIKAQVAWIMNGIQLPAPDEGLNVELGVVFTELPEKTKVLLNQYAVSAAPPSTG